MTNYRTYLFTYNFDGASWQIPTSKPRHSEGQRRRVLTVSRILNTLLELVATIPVTLRSITYLSGHSAIFGSNQ